jgi:WD40 repeat protein
VTEFPTGKEIHRLPHGRGAIWAVALSPEGKYALSGRNTGGVALWDVAGGKKVRDFLGHTASAEAVAFSPDGRFAVSSGVHADGTVRLWNVQTGKEVRRLRHPAPQTVFALAWLPDGKRIVTCDHDRSIRLWNAATGEQVSAVEKGIDRWWRLAVTRDGRRVAVGGREHGTLELLAVDGDTLRRCWSLQLRGSGRGLAFSPNDRLIAAVTGRVVQIRETSTGALLGQLEDRTANRLVAVAFAPDGKHLVTLGEGKGGCVRVWKLTRKATAP